MLRLAVWLVLALPVLPAQARELPNNVFVTLSGTVTSIESGDEFELDYGDGTIKVDTNDAWPNLFKGQSYHASNALGIGDRVWVSGRMDDNWFRGRELDAYTLYHNKSGKVVLYRSPPGRNVGDAEMDTAALPDKGMAVVTGAISRVSGRYKYLLQYGSRPDDVIQIDVSRVEGIRPNAYRIGDRVKVSGRIDKQLFTRKEINATYIAPVADATAGVEG